MISILKKKKELHFSEYLVHMCEITSSIVIADPNLKAGFPLENFKYCTLH